MGAEEGSVRHTTPGTIDGEVFDEIELAVMMDRVDLLSERIAKYGVRATREYDERFNARVFEMALSRGVP